MRPIYEWIKKIKWEAVMKQVNMKNFLRYRKVIALCLSLIVAFTTTYSLILPAITVSVEEAREMGGIDVGPSDEAVAAETTSAEEAAGELTPAEVSTVEDADPSIGEVSPEDAGSLLGEEPSEAGDVEDANAPTAEEQPESLSEDVSLAEAAPAEANVPLVGSVYAHSLNIRAEKSLEAEIVGTLEDAEIVTILNDAEVVTADEEQGFIADGEQEVEIVPEEAEYVEEPAAAEETPDGWLHIRKNDGTEGYVKDEYIILENETVEEKRPAATFAETIGSVSVSVEAPAGAFPAGTTISLTPSIFFVRTLVPAGIGSPVRLRADQSLPSTATTPFARTLSISSLTTPVSVKTRSAFVATRRELIYFFASGRVKISVTAETTMNKTICSQSGPLSIAAMSAVNEPSANQMEVSPTLIASKMPKTMSAPSQI